MGSGGESGDARPDALLLPAGTRLLHIGPHKTGTSSLQSAFHLARRAAGAHGVHYAGPNRQPLTAAQAAAAGWSRPGTRRGMRPWRKLVREIRAASAARVVISSEWFADAGDEAIRAIVGELDRGRVHVVLTVRPLAATLPSQWQQYIQAGMTTAFEPWLEAVLRRPGTITPTFWARHRHDQLAARWAAVVGVENVTVVVADERDRGAVLRAFERLVGLPSGLLVPDDDRANRSLTMTEIELIRATNAALDGLDVDPKLKQRLVLFGAAASLKRRSPHVDEPRIEVPRWADRLIAEAARSIVQALRGSGIRIVGDLDYLAAPPQRRATIAGRPAGDVPWPEVAGLGAIGVLIEAGLAQGAGRDAGAAWPDGPSLAGGSGSRRTARKGASAKLTAMPTDRLRKAFVGRLRHSIASRTPGRRHRVPDPADASPIHSTTAEVE